MRPFQKDRLFRTTKMTKISIGIFAHADAGKTTLSEALLFRTGAIRKAGRVDHRDAFLDNHDIERERGITVYSKEARFSVPFFEDKDGGVKIPATSAWGSDAKPVDGGKTERSTEAVSSIDQEFILVDTPGHADFSAEMERVMCVPDYAILVISGSEGVQSHTMTLWKLFEAYHIPVLIYINKTDSPQFERLRIYNQLKVSFGIVPVELFGTPDTGETMSGIRAAGESGTGAGSSESDPGASLSGSTYTSNSGVTALSDSVLEEIATSSEELMEEFLESGSLKDDSVSDAFSRRWFFPVLYGSALKLQGIDQVLETLIRFTRPKEYGFEFGARVYKITRDSRGNRMTHMKITGGVLKAKDILNTCPETEDEDGNAVPAQNEKAEQIRICRGGSFENVKEAEAGDVVAVTGLSQTYAGQGLGFEAEEDRNRGEIKQVIEPALTYRLILPEKEDPVPAIRKLKMLEEEDPTLHIVWKEDVKEIHIEVMGELELEILKYQIKERFGMDVSFGQGSIIYKETVKAPVIGVGHFEPLRHYAEAQILVEPLPAGSGMEYSSRVKEDVLALNWQRLIMTHLMERRHRGVLTGSELTDVRLTVIAGKAHLKHTMGGDFRQATYRAVRQALRTAREKGDCVLLEPMYSFIIHVPVESVGRVLTDMDRLCAKCELPDLSEDGKISIIKGRGPVSTLMGYQKDVNAFTGGTGQFIATLDGYGEAHNSEEIIELKGYDPDSDRRNPCGSVFCEHGAGTYVEWDIVPGIAHTESGYRLDEEGTLRELIPEELKVLSGRERASGSGGTDRSGGFGTLTKSTAPGGIGGTGTGNAELDRIFEQTYGKSKRDEQLLRENRSKATRLKASASEKPEKETRVSIRKTPTGKGEPYIVIDGYNVIFAWDELRELAGVNIDAAREAFIDILVNYHGYKKVGITVVFDGYRLSGNPGERYKNADINVVYTKEAETADRYIEKTVYEMGRKYDMTVVTSDRPVQMAAWGDGAGRMSAREFHDEVAGASEEIREKLKRQKSSANRPFEEALGRNRGDS